MKMIWNIEGKEADLEKWSNLADTSEGKKNEVLNFLSEWNSGSDGISANTSGTTGNPKSILLSRTLMKESAVETASYFKLGKGSKVLLCLPAKYIGGKMMIVRAIVNNWNLHCLAPSSTLELPNQSFDFTSMTPMQAHWLLREHFGALGQIQSILLGGAGVDKELMNLIGNHPSHFYLSYGMTETASHVAIRKLNGPDQSEWFEALGPYSFYTDERSCLKLVNGKGLGEWQTNDVVQLLDERHFKFIGRADHVINSGGVKIHPEELEEQLEAYMPCSFFLSSKADPSLGERLILVVEAQELTTEEREKIQKGINELHPHHRPKEILLQNSFDRTDSGKIIRKKHD